MNSDLLFWYAARIAALSAFVVLATALLTGMAIRTAYLSALAKNRAVLGLHTFLSWFWIPLVLLHVSCLLLDSSAGIGLVDLVIPFQVHLRGPSTVSALAIGLGTVAFLFLLLVTGTSLLRTRMSPRLWLWIHRLVYPLFGLFLLHAQLAGTDFSRTSISVIGWATTGMLLLLALPRVAGGRVSSTGHDSQLGQPENPG